LISFTGHNSLDVNDILGDGGLVAQSYVGFETRGQQLEMACAIQKAFNSPYHLAAEAGTGVGKSFAYLVPAIDQVVQKKGKVLISTYTITLQQQLINKDIPFLANILNCNFSAHLAKGRGNYLCLRRLNYAVRKQKNLFTDAASQLSRIYDWARNTEDGSLSELDYVPSVDTWEVAKSEHGNCGGRRCSYFRQCFYWKARRQLERADIIVANHALLFSDLVLKQQSAKILPEYKFVVIDEAQNVEHVAEDHFGINISNFTISYMLNKLYNSRTRKGILAFTDADDVIDVVKKCGKQAEVFFAQIRAWYEHAKDETSGKCHRNFVEDNITGSIKTLRLAIGKLAKKSDDADQQYELVSYVDKCKGLEIDLEKFLSQEGQEGKDSVYWVEVSSSRRKRTVLRSAPLNVGPDIKRCLFDKYDSVITTSATLSCDGKDEKAGFEFFASRIGLEDFQALKLGSPFDYQKQVKMYIESSLPNPNDHRFTAAAAEAIKKYLTKTDGSAFVLFTSYSMLKSMAQMLGEWMDEHDMKLLCQGSGTDRITLLEEFKDDAGSVLFGTDSFWQGVDVPGEALSNVIIVKLPFAVPNHPLIQGRIEQIRAKGENPFFKYQLPTAIIKFKQGFGRLIRNKTDHGIVVVLDSRIVKKNYGKQFLRAIPKCDTQIIEG